MFYSIFEDFIITCSVFCSVVYILRFFFPHKTPKRVHMSRVSLCGSTTQCTACRGCGLAKLK